MELEQGNDQTLIDPGKTKDVFVKFSDDNGDFYAVSVDTPAPLASSAGSSMFHGTKNADGTGGDISMLLVGYSNFGNTYKMTFRNTSNIAGYVSCIQLWGVPAKVSQVIIEQAKSEPSIEQFGLTPTLAPVLAMIY